MAPEYLGKSGAANEKMEEVEDKKAASIGAFMPSAPSVASEVSGVCLT